MLPLLFTLLLSLQWVAGDNLSPRSARQHNSAASPHVLSQLLVLPNPKFVLRAGCANGWQVCPNFPNECAPDGSFCCSDGLTNCPDGTNCQTGGCCPQNSQTCGGQLCCDPGATCCSGNSGCCDVGSFCCNDQYGGCCPAGTSCTADDTCSGVGSGGGSGGSGGSGPLPSSPPLPTFSPTALIPTIGGITPTVITAPSSSSPIAVASSTPGLGAASGSPHCISMTSIGKTVGLAVVVSIISFGGSIF
ncbi:hypothetical protein OG21DRAFT_1512521 [Imleria badia]|nr:hypothetical protein OG21DRAFT_1512521 [Imleria badia]